MNHFIAGILRIVLLEAGVALLLFARYLRDARYQRSINISFVLLAALAVFSWGNFGQLRGGGGIVHRWEQYHFFFGSKYLREVGYFDLYKATILADREGDRILVNAPTTRDLSTFNEVPVALAMRDADQVRARFTPQRWAEFKKDWLALSRGDSIWARAITDHGNSGSPAWAIFGAPLAYIGGISPSGQRFLALVDPVLLVVLFWFVFRTFGLRASCVSLWIFSFIPFVFDYLFGSLLRWDWLFALAMCFVSWQRGRPFASGAFLGYAIASKLFPLFFGVALLFKWAFDFARARKLDIRIQPFVLGGAACVAACVAISSLMFGPSIWKGYAQRIEVAQREKFYNNQYSFKTIFLQFAASRPGELEESLFEPAEIKQARADVDLSQYPASYLLGQLILTAIVAAGCFYAGDELEAMAAGPLLVFVWLTVNAYYWNMLMLPALIWARREISGKRGLLLPLIFLHASLAAYYLYQHMNHGYAEGYAGGLAMLALLVLWSASSWRSRRALALT